MVITQVIDKLNIQYTLHFNEAIEALQLYCWIKRQSLNHANSEKICNKRIYLMKE